MLDFIKTMFASAFGFALAVAFFFFMMFILIVFTSGDSEPVIRDNSVLHIKLSGPVADRMSDDPFALLFAPRDPASTTLEEFTSNLRKAAVDDKISGILLEIDYIGTSWPNLQQMRRQLLTFKESSGKFVYATTNDIGLNEQGYYIATVADSIFAPPFSIVQMDGFMLEGMFFADMFEKIGLKADVVHKGKYKSAGDSFVRTGFSEADREQLEAILAAFAEEFEAAVSARTGMGMGEVRDYINQMPQLDASFYYETGLIDAMFTHDELQELLKKRTGVEDNRRLQLVPNRRYAAVSERSAGLGRPAREAIAVIYADGPIMPEMGANPFGGETTINISNIRESLDKALRDRDVKAIVLRINSPGGAASTSDAIWHMVREASKEKPVIASMGAVAASGGYFIAMGADKIVAESTTITGSIGVIGMRISARDLFTDKLGITFDEIRVHDNANWISPTTEFNDVHRRAFENFVGTSYDAFVSRVAESRDKTFEEIHEVAQGRVWSGRDALEIGLIDAVGGLDDAIALAAEKVNLEKYSIKTLPVEKGFFELLAESSQVSVRNLLGSEIPYYDEISFIKFMAGHDRAETWAVMPYLISIK